MNDKEEVLHTREYCAAIRKEEPLPSATTWMNLRDIMLSEIRPKGKCCIISLICGIKKPKLKGKEIRFGFMRGGVQGVGQLDEGGQKVEKEAPWM